LEEISDELEEEAPLQTLPRKYINDMVKDVEDVFDHKYGVRYDAYKGTKGLYELLFKK
jgi:hypothetical protein